MNIKTFNNYLANKILSNGIGKLWRLNDVINLERNKDKKPVKRTIERWIASIPWLDSSGDAAAQINERGSVASKIIFESLVQQARKKRKAALFVRIHRLPATLSVENATKFMILIAEDGKRNKRWCLVRDNSPSAIIEGLKCLSNRKSSAFFPSGDLVKACRDINFEQLNFSWSMELITLHLPQLPISQALPLLKQNRMILQSTKLSHLDRLEAESIYIMREVMAYAENPVMLYSVGKDSAVMLHLAQKAFYPSTPRFPLMHVDTRWKFKAMYDFRDAAAKAANMDLIVHINPDGIKKNINPFDHGSGLHTDIMKTQGLKQALDEHGFDVAFGGARRDEEKSRAKERVFSFRNSSHRWDPKNQRPELWNLYNCRKAQSESVRVFPLSNWTELDIWQYIYRESIPIVPLYFAAKRPIIERNGMLIMVDDDRMRLLPGEAIKAKTVRFRTLGCYPLTGAVESSATDLSQIVLELLQNRTSERQGRVIDSDISASMEKKKREGYF